MKKLRQYHLYLGCIFAPVLILFAVSGTWQMWGKHHTLKNGSYIPPKTVRVLSAVHVSQSLSASDNTKATPLKIFMCLGAAGLVVTTMLGVIMAFRFSAKKFPVVLCLAAGVVVPFALLLMSR